MSNFVYLTLGFVDGDPKFYQKSKTPREEDGWVKHESEDYGTSYRKYYEAVVGELLGVQVKDSKFGQKLEIFLKGLDNLTYKAQVSLYNQRGNIDQYAESFIRFLPNMEKGTVYRLFPYSMETEYTNKEGELKKVRRSGISIKEGFSKESSKVMPFLHTSPELKDADGNVLAEFTEERIIPKLEWKEKLGKNKPTAASVEARDDFFLKWLEENLSKFTVDLEGVYDNSASVAGAPSNGVGASSNSPQPQSVDVEEEDEEDDDDLPF